MRIYTKVTKLKSFKNETKAQKYLEKVKKGFNEALDLRIFKTPRKKDDGKTLQVGYVSRLGKKSNGEARTT